MFRRAFARLAPPALAVAFLATLGAAQAATPAPAIPTPIPVPTVGPPGSASALPYPAYGTPAPGFEGVKAPGIPESISLKEAIAIAAGRSPALASARADVGVARAQARLAQSGLFPNLSADASSTRNYSNGSVLAGSTSGGGSGGAAGGAALTGEKFINTRNSASATLNQLIFDGGRVAASIRAAKSNETASADLYRRELQTVAYNVATAYYGALAAERSTEVALQTVKLNEVQEDLVRAQVRAGAAARTDIATAQLPTAQARLALVRAQGTQLSAYASFANVMGLEANVSVKPAGDTPLGAPDATASTFPIPTYQQAVALALAQRPDYDASVQTLAAARASLRAAQLGLFPVLSGSGQGGTASTDPAGGTYRPAASLAVNLAIPLYDQGQTSANTLQARSNVEKAQANLESARLALQLNVQQALVGLVSARAALDQSQAEYDKAVEVLQATQAQYAAGVTTLPLLLNAQVGLTQALTDRVTSIYNLRTAEQALIYALGSS
jgi:outer membrane protein TolC